MYFILMDLPHCSAQWLHVASGWKGAWLVSRAFQMTGPRRHWLPGLIFLLHGAITSHSLTRMAAGREGRTVTVDLAGDLGHSDSPWSPDRQNLQPHGGRE